MTQTTYFVSASASAAITSTLAMRPTFLFYVLNFSSDFCSTGVGAPRSDIDRKLMGSCIATHGLLELLKNYLC